MAGSHEAVLGQIHEAVLDGRYVVTTHAWLEMGEDGLTLVDIESALLTGIIRKTYTHDPRGVRFLVVGHATDLETPVAVVVRFVLEDQLLVITTFVLDESVE
jgi:hypothetical protein